MTNQARPTSPRLLAWAAGLALAAALHAAPVAAQHLRIGLQEDADALDPHVARTFVGRIVFAGLCDKLVDYDAGLRFVPQLATEWQWSEDGKAITFKLRPGMRFHDGEPIDAEAVKFNLTRALTMQGSLRRAELGAVASIDVIDPLTFRMNLREPNPTLLSQLADRSGMIMSPKALRELGTGFATRPVCSGPFRFVERVSQDRIVLEKFDGHWDAANIHIQRVTYRPIPDTTVRFSNLQAGALDMIERLAPNDLGAARTDRRVRVAEIVSLGFQSLLINTNHGPRSETPLGRDPRVREALELSLDRQAINQVAFAGAHAIGNQPMPPGTEYHFADLAVTQRNVARARQLLQEAGVPIPFPIEMQVINSTDAQTVGQIIQSMAREAGFEVRLSSVEFASSRQSQARGDFQIIQIGWSGRMDPDGNYYHNLHSRGPTNDGKYSNPAVDRALEEARSVNDTARRQALYREAAGNVIQDRPRIYLWHPKWIYAHSPRVSGFAPNPDGIIRLRGVRMQ
ncbi:MAG: ABC transporter substrate-binding protein [Alphaproteobacteria bacterium]|nr:ABC transporter substrate-binding protein [Alphaproteobacteria bacterium]